MIQSLRNTIAVVGLLVGIISQGTSFTLRVLEHAEQGDNILFTTAIHLGYLTNLSNLWLVIVYAAALSSAAWLGFFRKHGVITSALATIMLVMLFQHLILNPTRSPLAGLDIYTDIGNHTVAPLLMLGWWLLGLSYQNLKWRHFLLIMAPAIFYPIYVVVRGPLLNHYPYAVIDVSVKGLAPVLTYMGYVVVGFTILCLIALGINQIALLLHRQKMQKP